MSQLFLVDLGSDYINFDLYNNLAKDLVEFALKQDIGVFFGDQGYYYDLIRESEIRNYFIVSDSFLYRNCGFLTTESIEFSLFDNVKKKKQFFEKFAFLNLIFDIVNKYISNNINVYISGGGFASLDCFEEIKSSKKDLLNDLYCSIIDHASEFAYGFPNVKLELIMQ